MHYKDGTPARAGDLVMRTEMFGTSGNQTIGILSGATSQSTTCNGHIIPVAQRQLSELGWGPWLPLGGNVISLWSVTLSDCERIDKMPSEQPAPVDIPAPAAGDRSAGVPSAFAEDDKQPAPPPDAAPATQEATSAA